eukprot:scaffold1160_cov261-Pinguiococcus_pyrenoidosus.AAC.3
MEAKTSKRKPPSFNEAERRREFQTVPKPGGKDNIGLLRGRSIWRRGRGKRAAEGRACSSCPALSLAFGRSDVE